VSFGLPPPAEKVAPVEPDLLSPQPSLSKPFSTEEKRSSASAGKRFRAAGPFCIRPRSVGPSCLDQTSLPKSCVRCDRVSRDRVGKGRRQLRILSKCLWLLSALAFQGFYLLYTFGGATWSACQHCHLPGTRFSRWEYCWAQSYYPRSDPPR